MSTIALGLQGLVCEDIRASGYILRDVDWYINIMGFSVETKIYFLSGKINDISIRGSAQNLIEHASCSRMGETYEVIFLNQ